MASGHENSEDPLTSVLIEEMICVTVGIDVKECKSILLWALQNSRGKRICIIHVHRPAQLIPCKLGGDCPASLLDEKIVRDHRKTEKHIMNEILEEYLSICRGFGVQAQSICIEMDYIEKGIVELISQHGIRKLVMGGASDKHYKEEASAHTETEEANHLISESLTLGHDRDINKPGPSNCLRSNSVALGHERNNGGSSITNIIPFKEGSEARSSPRSTLDIVEGSGSSDELDGSSRSPSGSGYSTSSPRKVVDVTLASWNENGLELNSLSPASCYSRSPLTFSLLQPSPTLSSSASTISTCSSNGAHRVLDGNLENTLYEQLQQAMAEAENETQKRQKAERGLVEAIHRAQEEWKQRIEVGEALAKEKEDHEKVKNQRDQVMEELRISQEEKALIKSQIAGLQREKNELQMERDNALKEAEELRRKLAEASRHMPQFFSEFLLSEIEEATQGFDESLKIGQGGQLRHPNLVKLIGSCPETFALIYEYLPNGSLEDRLNRVDNSPPLSWKTRIRIATELCSVLVYLHSNKPHIVHGDLKPSNILLDLNFVSKLSDFGICHPEFVHTGELTIKSDVYSFGIILLQLLTNKPAFFIANEVKHALKAGNFKDLLDPLAGDWPIELAQELAGLALWCSHKNRKSRPDLRSDIWKVLQPMRDSCGASILIPTGS
uniref:RING-type E3 ubiquitin transferase n=1 Tax=Fagus sylvatica TaxID=28930 RepID=A0A2N9FHW5_FAGSY